jgi:glutathione peroxidase-family protein
MRTLVLALLLFATVATAQVSTEVRRAPDFPPDVVWLDQEAPVPHSIRKYRGQVVLIDFWEYTCINCIRDFAVVKRWYRKYHPYGFEVIGVHFGEFSMGFNPANVEAAAKRFRLPWPVVADVRGAIWNRYQSEAWPNRYLIAPDGNIVMQVEGEGNNQLMEAKIRELLAASHPEVKNIALDPKEKFTPACGIPTQETYVGDWFGRGALENSQRYRDDATVDFRADRQPDDGGVVLAGKWLTAHDGVTARWRDGSAALRYHARSLYAVMSLTDTKTPVRVYLLQDGKPLTSADAGVDVRFDAQGSYLEVRDPRMYYLVKNPAFGAHLLTLQPQAPGFTLHSFTYGNNCQQDFEEK